MKYLFKRLRIHSLCFLEIDKSVSIFCQMFDSSLKTSTLEFGNAFYSMHRVIAEYCGLK